MAFLSNLLLEVFHKCLLILCYLFLGVRPREVVLKVFLNRHSSSTVRLHCRVICLAVRYILYLGCFKFYYVLLWDSSVSPEIKNIYIYSSPAWMIISLFSSYLDDGRKIKKKESNYYAELFKIPCLRSGLDNCSSLFLLSPSLNVFWFSYCLCELPARKSQIGIEELGGNWSNCFLGRFSTYTPNFSALSSLTWKSPMTTLFHGVTTND